MISRSENAGPGGSGIDESGAMFTLTKSDQHAVAFKPWQSEAAGGIFVTEEYSPTLQAQNNGSTAVPAVAFESRYARNGRGAPSDIVPPLKAQSGETGKGDAAPLTLHAMQVRRLTPRECERLQGFPDDYTLIPITKRQPIEGQPAVVKMAADGPRYKALGNSFAVPVMAWIGKRIAMVDAIQTQENEVAA